MLKSSAIWLSSITPTAVEPDTSYTWAQFIGSSVLLIVMCLCACLSVFYSFRYRRSTDPAVRGLNQAKTNINMGITLIAMSLILILTYEANWLRAIIGAIFLLMGLFNLFAGIRNRRIFLNIGAKQEERKQ
jgi:amino acid transporter